MKTEAELRVLVAEYRAMQEEWMTGEQTPELAAEMAELWWTAKTNGINLAE